jgi:hypothetical protein
VALILIYILVVWEFGNFVVPAVIMAPIPLTLIGIIPGHWLLGAEFTATSMIGFIALAGIIVRNSILLVDFTITQVKHGVDVREAVIISCKTRTRPIMITAWALVMGSTVILFDPIFQGMAISLLFGVLVSTMLTLVVIPLGCISARAVFCPPGLNGENCEVSSEQQVTPPSQGSGLAIGDVVMGMWRFFSMVMRSLLFKLWTLAMGALFGFIEMWQSRKAVAATSSPVAPATPEAQVAAPVVQSAVLPSVTTPVERAAPTEAKVEPKVEPAAVVAPKVEPVVAVEAKLGVEPVAEAGAEPSAVVAKKDKSASKVSPVKRDMPKKKVVTKTVKSSPIKKKSVTKKKIALKQTAVKKAAPGAETSATRKGEGDIKENRNRRGIRLKNFDDDFNL